jgi:polysaccharide export outer membrane protein
MTPLLLLFMLVIPGHTSAQEVSPPSEPVHTVDYRLGPGDLLQIHVAGHREFEQITRVSNSGRIHVPYVGIMLVAGRTVLQVERDIARLIKEHELIKEPSVRVQIDQYHARPAYVIGDVNAPGQYAITGEMYLLDLISKAGGLLGSADDVGFLYRRNSPEPTIEVALLAGVAQIAHESSVPETSTTPPSAGSSDRQDSSSEEVIQVDFAALRDGTQPQTNVRLQGGDVLFVPRMSRRDIFVIGDVRVPGSYGLPRHGEVTAVQAIIYAGGPLSTAKMSDGFLMRHDDAGVRHAFPVDFAAIIEGRSPDVPVQSGDIIFVPNSAAKTVGLGILNMLPRLAQQLIIF